MSSLCEYNALTATNSTMKSRRNLTLRHRRTGATAGEIRPFQALEFARELTRPRRLSITDIGRRVTE